MNYQNSGALLLCVLLAGTTRAQEARPENYQSDAVPRLSARRKQKTLPKKIWEAHVSAGMTRDNNINHLLINSTVNSGARLPDEILHTGAGISLFPSFGRHLSLEAGYDYDRYDYRRHKAFSYYTHSVSGDVYPWLTPHWALDVGGDLEWTADRQQPLSTSRVGRLGMLWTGPMRLRVKAGYEKQIDRVLVNRLKDANSNGGYLSLYFDPLKKQTVFASYRYRVNAASGNNYSYQSHSLRLGWINRWTSRFKVTWSLSGIDKIYRNTDSRFLLRRHEKTYFASVKPVVRIVSGLELEGSYTYTANVSNVSIKKYSDQLYRLSLNARF